MKIMIYQTTVEAPNKFIGYDLSMKHGGIYPEMYKKVYQGYVPAGDLEEVFMIFNNERPDGFIGHSMSVSDIIVDMYTNKAYYCDSFGFKEIEFEVNANV